MNSLYKRQFALMAGLVVFSFALLSAAFMSLSYQYIIREKRETMERNASDVASFTAAISANGIGIEDGSYQAYIANFTHISGADVLLADVDGEVVLAAADGSIQVGHSGYMLPQNIVRQMEKEGSFAGISNLGGFFTERRYVTGAPIEISVVDLHSGQQVQQRVGVVYMAMETTSMTMLWWAFIRIFGFTAVIVLCAAFIISSVTSLRLTNPLKEIAGMARKFGHGEYEARVTGYENRKDEVGELAEAFNSMADSIARSEARRAEFVANISHELKTPLTTIAGFTDGILDGTIPPEKARTALQTISVETRRLSRLIRRMLDLSRLQSAETVTAQERFDVSEVMLRVLVNLENKINDKELDVETKLPDNPVMVWGDPDSITQVCYNLLDNAIKFAANGTAIGLTIATKGGKAYVTVRNTGLPIPPEELPLIFDRFHKSDKSRSEDRDGVGLGLYIVKTILNAHKENITVTSEDGATEFTFTLTLA